MPAILSFEGFDGWTTQGGAAVATDASNRGYYINGISAGCSVVTSVNRPGKRLYLIGTTTWMAYDSLMTSYPAVEYLCSGVSHETLNQYAEGVFMSMLDGNNQALILRALANGIRIYYNPGNANNIDVTLSPYLWGVERFFEIEWTPSFVKIWIDGVNVYTKNWSGVFPLAKPGYLGQSSTIFGGTNFAGYYDNIYYGPSRIGDFHATVLTLEAPIVSEGVVTGAANAQTALTSFDGDNSYYTVANGTGQRLLLDVSNVAAASTIHGVKVTTLSKRTETGAVASTILINSGADYGIGTIPNAVGYTSTTAVVTRNPATGLPFTLAELNALKVGFKEGL